MTWRERIVAARERGGFLAGDSTLSGNIRACAAWEVVCKDAGMSVEEAYRRGFSEVWDDGYGLDFHKAVLRNNFDAAESFLDAIEDRVLQLKREAST